jgi:hypothetical protein
MLVAPIKETTRELRIYSSTYCHDPAAGSRDARAKGEIHSRLENWVEPGPGSIYHFVISLNSIRRFC